MLLEDNIMKSLSSLVVLAAVSLPLMAHAAAPTPGEYSIGGIQNICLQSSGSWYGTTFSGWGGQWQSQGAKTYIYGNYASGAGNDGMFLKNGRSSGVWQEWRDDLSFSTVLTGVSMTKLSNSCPPPPATTRGGASDPGKQ
jgi:hypothetical protein